MSRHIEQVSALDAFARAKKNPWRRYPTPQSKEDRLYPLANPMAQPSFEITQGETFFAIGSCFARNVETALTDAGMTVTSTGMDLGPVGESLDYAQNFFNKYSVHSVYNDLRWALEPETFPGEDILYHIPGKTWYADLQLGIAKLEFPPDEIMAFRRMYLDVLARVATADVVIITLGYVETWFDKTLGVYLNTSPPQALIKAEPDRFEFRVLSYEEVLETLHKIYALLNRHRTKPLKMLLTVSPVPLLSTFRDMDVLVANTYSKSVQRAAIDAFVRDTTHVDYFPSYEFVTLSNPAVAWQSNDYRHVSSELVARIMQNVMAQYLVTDANADPVIDAAQAAMQIKALHAAKDYKAIVALVRSADVLTDASPDLVVNVANAFARVGELQIALDLLHAADKHPAAKGGPLELIIRIYASVGHPKLEAKLEEHRQRYAKRDGFRNRIAHALAQDSNNDS